MIISFNISKVKIILKKKADVIFEKTVEISPEKAFTNTLKIEQLSISKMIHLY